MNIKNFFIASNHSKISKINISEVEKKDEEKKTSKTWIYIIVTALLFPILIYLTSKIIDSIFLK